eukprot:m.272134 g.272134  ORF g.272134 m.272134 type:complete len:84 (-) comp17674_c2_seq4:888-1139(-)
MLVSICYEHIQAMCFLHQLDHTGERGGIGRAINVAGPESSLRTLPSSQTVALGLSSSHPHSVSLYEYHVGQDQNRRLLGRMIQ